MTPRRYEQRARAESAERTRRAILDAVYGELRKSPSTPVAIDRVASEAGVARSTVYVVFGSRAGLFDAFAADLWERSGYDRLLEAIRVPDPLDTLRDGIRVGVDVYAADRDVFRALFSMAALDSEAVGGAIGRIEQNRTQGMAWLAGRLARMGALREGVGQRQAAHVLWMATSFEGFDLLYTGRGLGARAVADVLVSIAERTLLAEPG